MTLRSAMALLLGCITIAQPARPAAASQPPSAVTQAWGPTVRGLRMSIAVSPDNLSPANAEFVAAIENTGDRDFVVNLGSMLANGKTMLPTGIRLAVTNSAGRTQELEFAMPPVAGQLEPFAVPLRRGSSYVLRTSLALHCWPCTSM